MIIKSTKKRMPTTTTATATTVEGGGRGQQSRSIVIDLFVIVEVFTLLLKKVFFPIDVVVVSRLT